MRESNSRMRPFFLVYLLKCVSMIDVRIIKGGYFRDGDFFFQPLVRGGYFRDGGYFREGGYFRANTVIIYRVIQNCWELPSFDVMQQKTFVSIIYFRL
jgi:hypothetical protein